MCFNCTSILEEQNSNTKSYIISIKYVCEEVVGFKLRPCISKDSEEFIISDYVEII